MITRDEVLTKACTDCLKDLYKLAQPSVDWDDFIQENKEYAIKYKEWENKSITECIEPRPFEFYYLPKEVMKEIADSYVRAYKIDSQQNLLDIIDILKTYCKEPIVDKWIERNGNEPGYRGYEHPDNLVKQLTDLVPDSGFDKLAIAESIQNKFFEFLDMAGEFYNWNRDLNTFNTTVYLGPSPSSNKQAVIDNWKKYRNKDITIDDSVYENEEE